MLKYDVNGYILVNEHQIDAYAVVDGKLRCGPFIIRNSDGHLGCKTSVMYHVELPDTKILVDKEEITALRKRLEELERQSK